MRIGFLELAVILAIVLLILGPKQLPKLTSAINNSAKEFKKELKKTDESIESTETVNSDEKTKE